MTFGKPPDMETRILFDKPESALAPRATILAILQQIRTAFSVTASSIQRPQDSSNGVPIGSHISEVSFFLTKENLMNTKMTKLAAAAVLALSFSAPALAQQADWSQTGDYYAPMHTTVQQPTAQELNQARQGDFYAPGKTVVQQATPQQENRFREGDFYAPTAGE